MSLYELSTEVLFSSRRQAEIAYDVLRVDLEPKRSKVSKDITISDNALQINLQAPELRNLRVSINSILDHLLLIVETMTAFGPPVSNEYSHYNA